MRFDPGIGWAILVPLLLAAWPAEVRAQPVSSPSAPNTAWEKKGSELFSPSAAGIPKAATENSSDPFFVRQETLEEAWAAALVADQALEARQFGAAAAQQTLQSTCAQRWPVVGVDGSYTVRSDPPAFVFSFPGIPLPTDVFPYAQQENFAFRGRVDYPLYTGGRIQSSIDAAAAQSASTNLDVAEAKMELKLRVAEEYVLALRAERALEVSECNVRSLESHLHVVGRRYEQEQVSRNDVLAAQVALSDARQAVIKSHNALDICRATYNRRLGRPLATPVQLAALSLETPQTDLEGITSAALSRRPALASLAAQAQSLQRQADSVLAKNRPQVQLRGEYAWEENRYRTPQGIAAAGVGCTWNVFDGGQNRYGAAALMQQAEGTRRLQRDLESRIALEVRRAWLEIQETRSRLEVTPETVEQAEENLRVAQKRYACGMGINTVVLDAESQRTQAYRNHYSAMYDAVLAVLHLRYATGEL